jgi:HD-GYP domain-containing protein (c-di-GMP phosphodiesterase class II)
MGLPDEMISDIVLAAVLHDIGALSTEQRLQIISANFNENASDPHSYLGYQLLKGFDPLKNAAEIIRNHHAPYSKTLEELPIGCYVVHLADRIAVVLDETIGVLDQVPMIMKTVEQNSNMFHPDTLAALDILKDYEYFWVGACTLQIDFSFPDRMRSQRKIIEVKTLRSFAKLVANLIDYRSRFTSTHSSGVAAVAMELTRLSGFSDRECQMMEIAGFLHDLGKLAVSNEILEKSGALSDEEIHEMRKHTYYTYIILNKIKGLEHISSWAAYHHEKLNGNGYPFHIKGEDFSKLARIMAVADIFTAITEDRPYRVGMSEDEALRVIQNMAKNGSIDSMVAKLAEDNFSHINDIRAKAQQAALEEFSSF